MDMGFWCWWRLVILYNWYYVHSQSQHCGFWKQLCLRVESILKFRHTQPCTFSKARVLGMSVSLIVVLQMRGEKKCARGKERGHPYIISMLCLLPFASYNFYGCITIIKFGKHVLGGRVGRQEGVFKKVAQTKWPWLYCEASVRNVHESCSCLAYEDLSERERGR